MSTTSSKPSLADHPDWEAVLKEHYRDERDPHAISSGSHYLIEVACPDCGKVRGVPARNAIKGILRCRSCANRALKRSGKDNRRHPFLTELPEWEETLAPYYRDEKDPSTLRASSAQRIMVECPDCHTTKTAPVRSWATDGRLRCRSCATRHGRMLDETDSWEENGKWYRDERDPHTIPSTSRTVRIVVECPGCHDARSIYAGAFTQGKLRHCQCSNVGRVPKNPLDESDRWEELKPYYRDARDPHFISYRSRMLIDVECPGCGTVRPTRISHFYDSPYCQECGIRRAGKESSLEREAKEVLESLDLGRHGLSVVFQWFFPRFNECARGGSSCSADFAILREDGEVACLIELQGAQHYEPVDLFGGEDALEMQMSRDSMKRNWCCEHGVPMLEVCCYEPSEQRRHNIVGFLTAIDLLPFSEYEAATAKIWRKAA